MNWPLGLNREREKYMTSKQAFEISEKIRNKDNSITNDIMFDSIMCHIQKDVYQGKYGIVHLFNRYIYPELEISEINIQHIVDKLLGLGFAARRSGKSGVIVIWNPYYETDI